MTPKRFEELTRQLILHCQAILLSKNAEYSRDGDRLWNFKVAARKRNCTPEEALLGMQVKHEVSIEDIVADITSRGADTPAMSHLFEKFGDTINYYLLLFALIVERKDSPSLAAILGASDPACMIQDCCCEEGERPNKSFRPLDEALTPPHVHPDLKKLVQSRRERALSALV